MKRRHFLAAGTAASLSTCLALWFRARGSAPKELPPGSGLVRDPQRMLDLPPGFSYRVVERVGDPMSDGHRVPGRPDAMGCFALADGSFALMRNHELEASQSELSAYPGAKAAPAEAYDAHAYGGVSRVVLDAEGRRLRSNLVLAGTARNCAGGISPWGWLSCEENVDRGHGYVFLCAADAERLQPPRRIDAYGRFLHEAVAIDPADHAAYLTEDRKDGCLYRFVPARRDAPFGEGRLQALALADQARFDLGAEQPDQASFAVRWVDLPRSTDERADGLRYAAQERGAAIVKRGEGIWRVSDGFAFTCTEGGPISSGQIYHLAPTPGGGRLRLLAQSRDEHTLDMPDNVTMTPWGDLLVCEDNHRSVFLRLVTQQGRVIPFAHNSLSRSEFAGVCFSPDGRHLFVNIQENGLTLAITGDWATLRA
jgi:secreted PhoX family phosphatase